MSFQDRLKAARSSLGLTQAQIAALSGVSTRSYQGYEDGRSLPCAEAIAGIVNLGVNANWLLTGEGEMLLKDVATVPPGALDPVRLRLAIEAVEEGLAAAGRLMAADKKAELVLAVYDLLEEPGVKKERILKLVKLAA